jgi:hypothetical protein
VYGPWYSSHDPILRDRDGGLVENGEEEFRHLIELVHGAENKWSERADGYLVFFHIRVPLKTDTQAKAVKGQPQILRASVYHLKPHVNESKPVEWATSFPSASPQGVAASLDNQFRGKVEEVLVQHGFTIETLVALVKSRISHLERHPLPVS